MRKKIASGAAAGSKQIVVGAKEAQPWRVTLLVRDHLLSAELKPVVYYVRGLVDAVGSIAYMKWNEWEKRDVGLKDEQYPEVEDYGTVEAVDEQDFMSSYMDIKKYKLPHAVAGNPANPTVFTCFARSDV